MSDEYKVTQPKRIGLGHFVFGKCSARSAMLKLVPVCEDVTGRVEEGLWCMRARIL